MRLTTILGLGVFLLAATGARAQVETQGRIVVIVEDPQGSRLPGAAVTASAPDTVTSREAVTNDIGEATLVALSPSAQYTVTVQMPGFAGAVNENVLVRSGSTATLHIRLNLASVAETVTVTSETPLVDTRSASTGQDVTLDLTESLPTARTYQGYLQLVPGVMPDDPDQQGNPSSKSGLNYRDAFGDVGSQGQLLLHRRHQRHRRRHRYFRRQPQHRIIQEQNVLTAASAEYVAPGLLSNVVLKAGSNTLSGSVNYFFQNDGLQAENENLPGQGFSRYDAAFTIGGPIVKDKAWFFGSYRRVERDDDVVANDTQQFLRSVNNKQDQGYARGTFSPTSNDTFSFTFLNDPTDISGRREPDISNAQDRSREQGGNRYNIKYSRLIGMNALLDVGFNEHNGAVSDFSAVSEPENLLLFRATDDFTRADQELGGWGEEIIDERDTKLFRTGVDYSLNVHDLKAGFEWKENSNFRDGILLGSPVGASWVSLAPSLAGVNAGDIVSGGISGNIQFDPTNSSDYNGLIRTINARPDRDAIYDAYDVDGDGALSDVEIANGLVFTSTAGNPNGQINYDRTAQTTDGEQFTKSRGLSFYGQDSFRFNNFVFNAGLRLERWEHFNTDGDSTYAFPWTWAPRLSAVYDLGGQGRQKISGYWGRYFDPIRNDMTNFADPCPAAFVKSRSG
jgi:hypothetical protein